MSDDQIGIAPVDMFSLAHFSFGALLFFIFSFFMSDVWAFVITVLIGIIWEPIENKYILEAGMKWKDRKDSKINSFFDVVFVTLGAGVIWWIDNVVIDVMIWVIGFVIFLIWYIPKKKEGADRP